MNLTSPSQVKAWCIEHDFHPNKTLGQNFLIDRNVLEAIVDAGLEGVDDGEPILEIGPGLGVMTQELIRRGHDVVAIEKDPFLAEGLGARVEAQGNLTVLTADALDVIGSNSTFPQYLISNLPYQAGTRILLELVQRRELKSMTVLVQTEVAERLAAKEGGRTRSLAGVWAQLDYDVAVVRKVGANCFWPRPEVGSSVVRLVRHERNAALTDGERKVFHRMTKQAFAHRRKQLGTIFKKDQEIVKLWNCENVKSTFCNSCDAMESGNADNFHNVNDKFHNSTIPQSQRRPEELSVEEWILLTKGVINADT